MKSPTTTAELGSAIESLIASYMEGVREAAEQAVARALAAQGRGRSAKAPRTAGGRSGEGGSSSSRRSSSALDETSDALCELVRAKPGSSMVELAEQLESSVRELQRPMARLRAEGRVRTVGQRHLMRYFPAVTRGIRE